MTSTALKERTVCQVSEDQSFMGFFPNPRQSVKSSEVFVKQVTAVAISTILFVRNLFNAKDFADRHVDGHGVKILKGSRSNSPGARMISKWLEGAFDAIEHKYLHILTFEIIEGSTSKVAEIYQLKFKYTDGATCSVENKSGAKAEISDKLEDTCAAVKQLIRNIFLISSLHAPLPLNCSFSMKLQYYEEVTPRDYEPPGFQPCMNPLPEISGPNFRLGSIATPFHLMGVSSKNKQFNSEASAPETDKSDLASKTKKAESNNPDPKKKPKSQDLSDSSSYANQLVPSMPESEESTMRQRGTAPGKAVKCECGKVDFLEEIIMLLCKVCHTYQHAACYKKMLTDNKNIEKIQANHLCVGCKGNKDIQGGMNKEECIFRRALLLCTTCPSMSLQKLSRELLMDIPYTAILMRRLQREDVLRRGVAPITTERPECLYSINKSVLKQKCIPKYFNVQVQHGSHKKLSENKCT